MPYVDKFLQCTFERRSGEHFSEPETYTCTCPECGAVVSGRSDDRSIRNIAARHKWVYLRARKSGIAFCSKACAVNNKPQIVARHLRNLRADYVCIAAELESWGAELP